MRVAPRTVRVLFLALLLAALLSAGVEGAVQADAASKAPTVVVTPRADLSDPWGDGQYVNVAWKNFTPNAPVGAKECVHGATSLSQCTRGNLYSSCGFLCPGDWLLGISDKNGNGAGSVPIAVGLLNVDQDRTTPIPGYTFRCGPQDPCDLWISNDTFDLSTGVFMELSFQPANDGCVGGGISLLGSGPSSGVRQFRALALEACKGPDVLDLGYVLKVSRDAMDDYIGGFAPYAVTSQAMGPSQEASLETAGRTAGYAPILASGEVFAYRIFDTKTLNQYADLTLTPELIARIFSGQLKDWNSPQIKALNPGVSFPGTIGAIGRGDASEETLKITTWFWAAARDAWKDGGRGVPPAQNPYTGPTDILPSVATAPNPVALVTGPQAVANTVRTGGADYTSTTQYGTIGYMDSSIAAQYGLPTLKIRYPNGKTVAATPATVTHAIDAMHADGHGVLHPDYSVTSASEWPIPVVSYMVIPHGAKKSDAPPDKATGDALTALVQLAVGTGQQDLARGYTKLPDSLAKQAKTIAGQVWVAPPDQGNNDGNNDGNNGGNNDGNNGGAPPPPPPGGGSTGGGSTSDPPPPPPPTDDPVVPVIPIQPVGPQYALIATSWSKALPAVVLFGLACLIVGAFMLFGNGLGTRVSRTTARVRRRKLPKAPSEEPA